MIFLKSCKFKRLISYVRVIISIEDFLFFSDRKFFLVVCHLYQRRFHIDCSAKEILLNTDPLFEYKINKIRHLFFVDERYE